METVLGALIGVIGTICGTMIGVVAGIAGACLQRRWAVDDLRREIAKRDVEELWMPIENFLDKVLQDVEMTWLQSQREHQVPVDRRLKELQRHLDILDELRYEHRVEFALSVLDDKPLTRAFTELFCMMSQLDESAGAGDTTKVNELVSEMVEVAAAIRRRKREILGGIYKS